MEESRLYLIFEFLSMDLKKYMDTLPQDKLMAPELVRSYLYQISAAMLFCHQRRILHRDLKPQNLLINRDGVIKVTVDFFLEWFAYGWLLLITSHCWCHSDCWLWFGPCIRHTGSSLYTWNCHSMVSCSGNPVRFTAILLSRGYLVDWLHILRDGNTKTIIPRRFGNRSTLPNVQVAPFDSEI